MTGDGSVYPGVIFETIIVGTMVALGVVVVATNLD
jgi:hypothetical protein